MTEDELKSRVRETLATKWDTENMPGRAQMMRLGGLDHTFEFIGAFAVAKDLNTQLAKWEGLTEAIRTINESPPDWPSHGNAPLAIAANYQLLTTALVEGITFVGEQCLAAREAAAARPEGSKNRSFYEGQATAYENVASKLASRWAEKPEEQNDG